MVVTAYIPAGLWEVEDDDKEYELPIIRTCKNCSEVNEVGYASCVNCGKIL